MSGIVYRIEHHTHYRYAGWVTHSRQQMHMTPRATPWQERLHHTLTFSCPPARLEHDFDAFGNPVCRAEFDTPYDRLTVSADMQVRIQPRNLQGDTPAWPWQSVRDDLSYHGMPLRQEQLEALRFRTESPHVRIKNELGQYARDCFGDDQPVLQGALVLMHRIHREFAYLPGSTAVNTPMLEAFRARRGVCQDFAHIMVGCLRSLGLAARYVSGYLRTAPPPGQARLTGADASHAWVAVYCPPLGWVEFDPTNDLLVNTDHIALAWGRDFGDVSPLRGVLTGAAVEEMRVEVTVTPWDDATNSEGCC